MKVKSLQNPKKGNEGMGAENLRNCLVDLVCTTCWNARKHVHDAHFNAKYVDGLSPYNSITHLVTHFIGSTSA
jgi:hypothetical protein